jgi:hypothetical protein
MFADAAEKLIDACKRSFIHFVGHTQALIEVFSGGPNFRQQ